MSKRSATEVTVESPGQPLAKAPAGSARRVPDVQDEMGEFEDAFEDEIESDEDVVDGGEGADADGKCSKRVSYFTKLMVTIGMDVDEVVPALEDTEERPPAPDVFIPGSRALAEDEVLEADDSVYEMRHAMNVNWPSLSFDVLRDNLGDERRRYPATAYIVAGSQADVAKNNEITVYKLSALHRTQKEGGK
jgi:ribosome assembly protein RRB1